MTMSQPENKNPGTSQADTGATDKNAPHEPAQTPPGKDPDEYDPVGMAGKKAGILLDLGEEAGEKATAEDKPALPKDKTGPALPGTRDKQD